MLDYMSPCISVLSGNSGERGESCIAKKLSTRKAAPGKNDNRWDDQ